MTTISTSSLSSYSTAFSVTIKKDPAATAAVPTATVATAEDDSGKPSTVAVDATGAGGATASSPSDAAQKSIDQLKELIKETEKQLQKEQQQLAAALNGNGSDAEKAQRAMAIQTQIASTTALLQSQQAALIQLTGGVNTTA
ncbi:MULTISPECIES: hypothetical protein [Pseudomonas]|jgi:hypothetical protein|uniref:FlxA-like protein n=1 Tax=Pseudomonas syringae TaxID=317 RepID=A0A085VF95_PSESX|nr:MULTISPECIES: hypothetical protein [Pseudomonas]EPJ80846.1 hypothetical protein CFII64_18051 [Pseudomonas sp. CFII64]KFE54108.1 hypothetical protein IV02_05005 [Pseudomonas syringae]